MQFSVYALDKADAGPRRAEHRDAHRARLRAPDHPVKVVMAGPLLGPGDAPIGSLLIVEAADEITVRAFVAADPYVKNDVYQSADIRPVAWTIGSPAGG
jgi:uncharacterized protein YciI